MTAMATATAHSTPVFAVDACARPDVPRLGASHVRSNRC